MSWHFSRALVEEYLAENSWDGKLSALLKSNPTLQVFLSKDRMKDFSNPSLFGTTLEVLTDDLGKKLLTWFLRASRVRILVSQEKERESQENKAACGKKQPELLVKYDLDSRSWKTVPRLPVEDSTLFLGTWPKWGTMRNGVCSEAPMLELGIKENASGFSLPTIGKNEFKGSSRKRYRGSTEYRGAKMSEGLRICENEPMYTHPNFAEEAMGWPITWTESRPLETDRFQQWLRAHSVF